MSRIKGVIDPHAHDEDDMFIGWRGPPMVDRRFLLAALPLGLALGAGGAYSVASNLSDPGPGAWMTGDTHSVTGYLSNDPYPLIRVPDANAPFGVRTYLVFAEQKCTSALTLDGVTARPITASGVLIERRARRALEVPIFLDKWLRDADLPTDAAVANPTPEPLGEAILSGQIMDSKCFFGVMRPARGRTHKACASLCIRGGVPPSFWVRASDGREAVLLMTDANGGPLNDAILPLVAEPVRAAGRLVRVGDLLQFRADAAAFERL